MGNSVKRRTELLSEAGTVQKAITSILSVGRNAASDPIAEETHFFHTVLQ